mmetsp:Transcript_16941/g.25561  ORF Transcript_16941/g.25561 Transcript_16941/m.25561 type:complete len:339 (+) Transcript_16941:62-1078(+)
MNMSNKSDVLESQACNAVDDFSSRKIGSLDELSARLLPGNDSYLKSFRSRQMMEGLIVSSFGVNSDENAMIRRMYEADFKASHTNTYVSLTEGTADNEVEELTLPASAIVVPNDTECLLKVDNFVDENDYESDYIPTGQHHSLHNITLGEGSDDGPDVRDAFTVNTVNDVKPDPELPACALLDDSDDDEYIGQSIDVACADGEVRAMNGFKLNLPIHSMGLSLASESQKHRGIRSDADVFLEHYAKQKDSVQCLHTDVADGDIEDDCLVLDMLNEVEVINLDGEEIVEEDIQDAIMRLPSHARSVMERFKNSDDIRSCVNDIGDGPTRSYDDVLPLDD